MLMKNCINLLHVAMENSNFVCFFSGFEMLLLLNLLSSIYVAINVSLPLSSG